MRDERISGKAAISDAQLPLQDRAGSGGPPDALPPEPLKPDTLYRLVLGLDAGPRPMTPEELQGLDDPFGRLLRSGKPFPLTLRQVLAAINALAGTADALPNQLVFLVADGGHIPWTTETDGLERCFRFAVARGGGEFPLLVSSSTVIDSADDEAFLQVLGWDATNEVFHYYERRQGTYFWAGMSHHALEEPTRGRGPFDSHVNGSMVMKELRPPWIHWHAPQAGINETALAPGDPLRAEPLFQSRVTADRLEIEVVRPAIRRWNEARVRKAVAGDGVWRNPRHFLRQAITDTTVNLASSETASQVLADDTPLRPPLSFFLNLDTLFNTLELIPEDRRRHRHRHPRRTLPPLPRTLRRAPLRRLDPRRGRCRTSPSSPPSPPLKTRTSSKCRVQAGLLTRRFVACLTMTDFYNPVFSERRAALLRYAPEEASGPNPGEALEARFVEAVREAVEADADGAGRPDSPEREFLVQLATSKISRPPSSAASPTTASPSARA